MAGPSDSSDPTTGEHRADPGSSDPDNRAEQDSSDPDNRADPGSSDPDNRAEQDSSDPDNRADPGSSDPDNRAEQDSSDPDNRAEQDSSELVSRRSPSDVLPFEGLEIPSPTPAAPPPGARWVAFASILVGGLLGGLIGYGVADILDGRDDGITVWAALGGLVGAVGGATGVGIVASLTLQAMGEWRATQHPEAGSDRTPRRGRS